MVNCFLFMIFSFLIYDLESVLPLSMFNQVIAKRKQGGNVTCSHLLKFVM